LSVVASGSFEQIALGDSLGPAEIVVSRERNRNFADCCGFRSPRFMDDEAARAEGLPGIIFPGNLSLALMSKFVTDWIGRTGGRLQRIGATYRSPVQPDCALILNGFVTGLDPGARTAEIDFWMESDEGDRLVIGTATVSFDAQS
jgi:acyl dehydratase